VTRPAGDTNAVTLSVLSPPAGVSAQVNSPGTGNTVKVTFTASAGAPAGTYPVSISASDGTSSGSANLSLVVAIVAAVQSTVNNTAGTSGRLQMFMATSFQPAEWDFNFFTQNPSATTPLDNLHSQHIRLQPVSAGTPQKTPTTWDFSTLDAILNPVIGVADKSPELQIAVAPDFMRNPTTGAFLDPTYQQFATYCANLVKYYNTTSGFKDAGGVNHVHSSSMASLTPITWWGVFNEPNINGLSASDYTALYNAVVPAMRAVDPSLKFAAVELADFGSEPQTYLPTFVSGVTAQVDAVATHYYSSCNQADTDATVFDSISSAFVPHVLFIYSQLRSPQANPALANVPVWVTENNVNADFDKGGGISACNGTPFVLDRRGTSAFFAAWRPYVFSQLGQAAAHSLYHWDFDADAQFGEVDFATARFFLSYWVDYYLARYFPYCPTPSASCPSTGSNILTLTSTEPQPTTVEILATRNDDNSVVVMVANRAVHAPSDNNGAGDPRTVMVDLSALGPFTSATQLTIDSSTAPATGPAPVPLAPARRMQVTLGGYGVSFLHLKP
jgi:hypothetical protein